MKVLQKRSFLFDNKLNLSSTQAWDGGEHPPFLNSYPAFLSHLTLDSTSLPRARISLPETLLLSAVLRRQISLIKGQSWNLIKAPI